MTDPDAPQTETETLDRSVGELPPESLLDQNLDETNVEDALRARGGVTVNMLASLASLDTVIPGGGALQGLYDTLFRSKEMNDDFSMSNLGGTLEEYFRFLRGEVDQNGQKIEDSDDDDTVDRFKEIAERGQEIQREIQETFSESEIDAMTWVGDPNEVWQMDGISASRSTWLNAAKYVRKQIPQIAKQNNWTAAETADQTYWISQYEAQVKANNQQAADNIASQHLKPESKRALDLKATNDVNINSNIAVSGEQWKAATSVTSNATGSIDAGADIVDAASAEPIAGTVPTTSSPSLTVAATTTLTTTPALSHPPEIELTETYNAVATANPAQPSAAPAPAELARAAPVTTSTVPLNQTFSI